VTEPAEALNHFDLPSEATPIALLREAQSKVVRMILPEQTQTAVAGGGK
jgi:hypothetical protein